MPLPIPARNLVGKRVNWSTEGRSDLRAIDRDTALRLLKALNRFLKNRRWGDVKQLEGFDSPLFRLRVGNWRFIYRKLGNETIEIVRVQNRREAYR